MTRRLDAVAARAMALEGDEYRSVVAVTARQLAEPFEWTTARGSRMRAEVGDWLLTDGAEQWTVDREVFEVVYAADGEGRWRKVGVVRARRLSEAVTIETLEGPAAARPGDWLVTNPTGETWPIRPEEFARRYAPV